MDGTEHEEGDEHAAAGEERRDGHAVDDPRHDGRDGAGDDGTDEHAEEPDEADAGVESFHASVIETRVQEGGRAESTRRDSDTLT
ncbi:hypothetical protein GCM10009000_092820 [Halobacterium noricense]